MQSMEEIYRQHAQTVYRYLLAQTRSADLAEELTQETFYQAVRTAGQYRGEGKLTTWLCGIAKNVLRSYQRRHPPEEELDEAAAAPDTPDEAFLARESQLELLRKMQTLGSDAREVMYLRIFGALSFRDIGEILSRTENWARVAYYRGREALRKELEKDDEK